MAKNPKEFSIPSRDWPITASEAGNVLVEAQEIKANKVLYKAAIANLKAKKKALDTVT